MKTLEKLRKRAKSNNKGFSLVELIIVVAIMAVLVGVLAPQYIKYVEKSRVAADAANIEQVKKAMEVAAADEAYTFKEGTATVTISKTADATVTGTGTGTDNNTNLTNALAEFVPDYAKMRLKAKASKDSVAVTLKIDANGNFTVTATPTTTP